MYFDVEYKSGNHPMTVRTNSDAVSPTVTKQIKRVKYTLKLKNEVVCNQVNDLEKSLELTWSILPFGCNVHQVKYHLM